MSFYELRPRRRIKAYYDKLYYATEGNKSQRFQYVNPKRILQQFCARPSYEFVKTIAIERLQQTIKEQLEFLSQLNRCDEYDPKQAAKLSHNVFNWSYEVFVARRHLENCIWIEVMIRNTTSHCLDKQKIVVDLSEVKKFVELLFKVTRDVAVSGKNVDMEKCVWKPLRDAQRYSQLPQIIELERDQLKVALKELQDRFIVENVTECLEGQRKNVMALEEIVMNSDVWDPIEVRYELNWYRSIVNQNQYKTDIIHFQHERDIEHLRTKSALEKLCSSSVMNTYYAEVEEYKRRISDLQERFDLETDQMENNNNYIQAQIDKLRDTQKFLKQEILRFHREIEKRLAKEEHIRLEAEAARQAKEAAALALQEALKRKEQQAKGKVKGKSVGKVAAVKKK